MLRLLLSIPIKYVVALALIDYRLGRLTTSGVWLAFRLDYRVSVCYQPLSSHSSELLLLYKID